jgi:hypothetical protein
MLVGYVAFAALDSWLAAFVFTAQPSFDDQIAR